MTEILPLPPLDPNMDASQNHYWTYHSLPTLLGCKKPLTASQDEDLFIAVHQICELAFHQMILDLDRTLDALKDEATTEAIYFLTRVNALWLTVNQTMPILNTMRAFAEFRTSIGPTSGFQSFQFRRIEIMSGVKHGYWHGGTADPQGNRHAAEIRFDQVYGDEVERWFERYRDHNLVSYWERMCAKTDLTSLLANNNTALLAEGLASYDRNQIAFHRLHLSLAAAQLGKVGVKVGTGGTSFAKYLKTYEKLCAPLFPTLRSVGDLT